MKKLRKYGWLAAVGLIFSCHLPSDPENSWEYANSNELLVGIVSHHPYTIIINGNYEGQEVQMMNEFAEQNHLKVKWIEGSESELIKLMEQYKLHLLVGGFSKNTVWKEKVGLTKPYNDKQVWLVARGENRLVEKVEGYFLKSKNPL